LRFRSWSHGTRGKTVSNEQHWLAKKQDELRKYIMLIIDEYDNGKTTLDAAGARIGLMCKAFLGYTYDHAFTEGINAADLDDDPDGEETVEFEIDEDGDLPE